MYPSNADDVTYDGKVSSSFVLFLFFCLCVLSVPMVTFYLTFLVQMKILHSGHTGSQKGTKNIS